MDDVVSIPPQAHDHPLLRRRSSIPSSIVVAPAKLNLLLHHHSSSTTTSATTSSSSDDLELLSIRPNSHSYTSLKDLLPAAAVNSPRPSSAPLGQGGSDICIRNRLVKQAAWAYLQPMSTSPRSADGSFLRRIWPRIAALFDLVRRNVARVIDWTVRVTWIRGSR
ncbi:hypothetical protein C2S52_022111 [Perilla frutescens var. hirtella]|uniref:Uncharacterized protein n=1 Tax=Perilla frutescens var. hirtella TaxID=608512 RepID=A0AAD4PFP8_PERFH|nr:hypothetical protein C2S52_022111 [Perilla frutescens var. hirtella]KAH6837237.1 hypothetical protein C2S53_001061 [Perilla frutescens var. hirtella]